jgi:hypothetical protein
MDLILIIMSAICSLGSASSVCPVCLATRCGHQGAETTRAPEASLFEGSTTELPAWAVAWLRPDVARIR